MKKAKKIAETTMSRSEFNAAWKQLKADCSYCPWHRGDNMRSLSKHNSWKVHRNTQWR